MKKLFLNPFYLLFVIGAIFITSCGDDDEPIVIDPGAEGINVADGMYMAIAGEDPSSTAQLSPESVEDEGFTSQDRTGFMAGFMFLEAGDYNVVQIADKAVTATIGGTAEVVTDEGSACGFNDYMLVTTATGGSSFTVGNAGLYKVTHDQMTSELILYQIDAPGIIGSATPGGWSEDTGLTGSVDATGGSWTAEGVTLRSGEWKIRFNCRWNLARQTDPNGGLSAENGYQIFTNFGGDAGNLMNGNDAPNIQLTEDAVYTIDVDWDPRDGWTSTLTRTGDAEVITFNPNDFAFGLIGDATANGWDADRNFFYKPIDGGGHSWHGVFTMLGEGLFKFRTNDSWDFNLGGDLAAPSAGGPDIPTLGAGSHYIVISTLDEGETWTATTSEFGWSVIGEGSPSGDWDNDTDFTAAGFDAGITTYTLNGDFTTANWKFRAGHDWPLNLGGSFDFLNVDGADLSFSEAGNYNVTLTYDGEIYTAAAEKQ